MFGDMGFLPGLRQEPVLGRMGVGERLLGGEGLGGHDEQRGFRVQALDRLSHVRAVDIRYEVDIESFLGVRFQGLGDHDRAQVGPPDADVHHVGDTLARVAGPLPAAYGVTKGLHVLEDRVHLGHDICAVHDDGTIGAVAQRDVEHGALFGDVDLVPVEHLLGPAFEIRLPGEVAQELHRLLGDAILRVVQQQILELQGELTKTLGILGEEIPHVDAGHLLLVCFQRLPGCRGG